MRKAFLILVLIIDTLFVQSNILDKSSCIPGTIGGSIDVSPSGAATYQLPILVSPGSHGVQPNLSIVYSSQGGNGLLGWGWNLAGLSAISRVSKVGYYDGTFDAISLTTDAMALDGVRLAYNSSTNTYYPINNPYTIVTYNNTRYTVTTQDGVVMEYGGTIDSRIMAGGTSVPLVWVISKVTDPNGNFMDFIYETDNTIGESRIKEINYTGNSLSGKTPYNSVKFYYETRTDANTMYVAGGMVKQSVLLSAIKVFCEGILSKDYGFTYFTDQYSKLGSISLTADGVKYNPTIIDWSDNTSTIYTTIDNPSMDNLSLSQWYFGDFNGDGILDKANYYGNRTITVSFASSTGGLLGTTAISLPANFSGYLAGTDYLQKTYAIKDFLVLDWNNDGKDEILAHYTKTTFNSIGNSSPSGDDYIMQEDIVQEFIFNEYSNSSEIITLTYSQPQTTMALSEIPDEYQYYYADLDNDGSFEQLVFKNKAFQGCNGLNLTRTPAISNVKDVKFLDFDGDGRIEFLALTESGKGSIWEYNGTAIKNKYGNISTTIFCTNPKYLFLGDFNGDGKTDYLSSIKNADNSYSWYVKYSTGTTFIDGVLPSSINYIEQYTDTPTINPNITILSECGTLIRTSQPIKAVSLEDINNDGKTDIIMIRKGILSIYLSTGNSFNWVENKSVLTTANPTFKPDAQEVIYVLDLNNDGVKDILYGNLNYYINASNQAIIDPYQRIILPNRSNRSLFVNAITDGMGNTSRFTYTNHINNQVFGTQLPKPAFPLMLIRGPMRLATNLTTTNGGSTWGNTNYSFADGYLHLDGLGFLGFKTVTATDQLTGTTATSSYSYTIPGAAGIYSPWLTGQITTRGNITSSVTNTLEAKKLDIATKSFMAVITGSTSVDGSTGITTNTSSSFNETNGRVTDQTVSAGSWTVSTSTSYTIANGYVSKPNTIISTRSNGTSHSETTTYAYDPTYPFTPNSITSNGVTTSYTVSTYGNTTGSAMSGRSTSNAYDSKGRFVVSSTDVAGYTSTATQRPEDGAKLTETDPNGLTTTYSYTASGGNLITKAYLPDGNTVTKTLGWDTGDYLYFTKEEVSHGNTTTAYFNSAGQKRRVVYTGFKGAVHTVDYTYNADGSLSSEAKSGISTATTYSYSSGRVSSVTGLNLSVAYSYSGNSVTTTDNITGITQTKSYDAMGNVGTLSSTTGNIAYMYNALCKVTGISAGGSTTSMTYDQQGNQLTLTDPDAGTTTYTYAPATFDLLTQTDAKGQLTSCTYDYAGRLIAKSAPGLTETYVYDESAKRKGLLKSATRDGVTESYTYDDLGRLTATTVTGNGKTFTTTRQYNDFGQLFQVGYPSGLIAQYGYDGAGNLTSITDATTSIVLWAGDSKNDRGQWASFTLGNGLTTKWGYDASYQLDSIQTGTTASSTSVQNLGFSYNAKGQLTTRTDGSLSESFGYDGLNRLISSTVGAKTYSYSYWANGNIDSTTLAGRYSYTAAHPHAVGSVAGVSSTGQSLANTTTSTLTADNMILTMDNGAYKNVFAYGPSGSRFKVDRYASNSITSSKIYAGGSEFIYSGPGDLVCKRTMVYSPTGICAVYQDSLGVKTISYIHTDYLGSWLSITDNTGSLKNRYSYDAWGRPRDPYTWALKPIGITSALVNLSSMQPRFDRGYTGHEHMAGFGLINMNGRLYDPYLQRFLSPDNVVQAPDNAQSYNRYTYCLNNPLMYTDPSGYTWMSHFGGWIGENWKTIGISMIAAAGVAWLAAPLAIGMGIQGVMGVACLSGMAGGFAGGFAGAAFNGGNLGQCLTAGFVGGVSGGISGALMAGVIGGIGYGLNNTFIGPNSYGASHIMTYQTLSNYSLASFLPHAGNLIGGVSNGLLASGVGASIMTDGLLSTILPMPEMNPRPRVDIPWMNVAQNEYNKGIYATGNNPEIIKYFSATNINTKSDGTYWCAAYANWCLQKGGVNGTGTAWGPDFESWGQELSDPANGALAVFKTGHVGFVVGKNGDNLLILHGNWSHSVTISTIDKSEIKMFRYPNDFSPTGF